MLIFHPVIPLMILESIQIANVGINSTPKETALQKTHATSIHFLPYLSDSCPITGAAKKAQKAYTAILNDIARSLTWQQLIRSGNAGMSTPIHNTSKNIHAYTITFCRFIDFCYIKKLQYLYLISQSKKKLSKQQLPKCFVFALYKILLCGSEIKFPSSSVVFGHLI